jgi:hypothetical protein
MYRYPQKIETLIDSERISAETELENLETVIEKEFNGKLYVIQWICYRIRSCLVFDLDDNLIDFYDSCALLTDKMYKGKSYYEWIGIDVFGEGQ